MAKKITFTMSVIYDEEETHSGNALHAIEHEMYNVDGLYEWSTDNVVIEDVEYDEE